MPAVLPISDLCKAPIACSHVHRSCETPIRAANATSRMCFLKYLDSIADRRTDIIQGLQELGMVWQQLCV